jgi:hypothetical protein
MSLTALCTKHNITIAVKSGAPENPDFTDCVGYTVTLHAFGKRLTTPYYMGSGLNGEPKVADVLGCLLSDASSVASARSFEDWAYDLGYDLDSRRAEKIYWACEQSAGNLEWLLGENLAELTEAAQDY